MTYEEQRLRDLRATAWGLLFATAAGLLFVFLRYALPGIWGDWKAAGLVFIALLWSAAWFASGFILGFLFGIPKVPQGAKDPSPQPGSSPAVHGSEGDGSSKGLPYQLRVNTNLEEISDWLTKILVGATLTQLIKVPAKIADAAKFMSDGMGAPGSVTFAAAILVYFSAAGFFAGYVLTRMFFSGAFVRSDTQLSSPDIDKLQGARISLDPNAPKESSDVLATAEKTSGIKITSSLSGALAAAIASAALLTDNTGRAVQAAKIAVDKAPDDPRVHLNYAIALYRNNASENASLVRQELEKTLEIVNRKANAETTEDIYNSTMYFYLYVPEPEGFTRTIEYGEEYLRNKNVPSRQSIWVNLACAYGQQYNYLQSKGETAGLDEVKRKAFDAIQNALKINKNSAVRFRELATGSANPLDNDLKVFESDPAFKALIGLP